MLKQCCFAKAFKIVNNVHWSSLLVLPGHNAISSIHVGGTGLQITAARIPSSAIAGLAGRSIYIEDLPNGSNGMIAATIAC